MSVSNAVYTRTAVALHWLTGTAVADDRLADWLLTATTLLLVWRLGMRVGCTAHDHSWRQAGWSLPRFFVGNIIALIAAPRAIRRYLTLLRGGPLIWDKTAHAFPEPGMPPA